MSSPPGEEIEDQGQDQAEKKTGCKGKIKGDVFPLKSDVSRQPAQPSEAWRKTSVCPKQQPPYDYNYQSDKDEPPAKSADVHNGTRKSGSGLYQLFCNLDCIEGRPFTEVIGHDPEMEAVGQ